MNSHAAAPRNKATGDVCCARHRWLKRVAVCYRHQQQVSKFKCENEALKDRLEAASHQLVTVSDSRLQLEKSLEEQKLSAQRLQRELESARRMHAKEVGDDSSETAIYSIFLFINLYVVGPP